MGFQLKESLLKIVNEAKAFQPKPAFGFFKILMAVLVITAAFSALKLYVAKSRVKAEIHYIEMQFDNKEISVMKSVLQNCAGDLSDSDTVQQCVEFEKQAATRTSKAELKNMQLKTVLWWVFWLSTLGIALSVVKKFYSVSQIFQISAVIWERFVWNRIKKLFSAFQNK